MENEVAERLKEIAERESKATPGEWGPHRMPDMSGGFHQWTEIGPYPNSPVAEITNDYENWEANADFIAHSRTDIPYLLALVGELQAEAERLRADLEHGEECEECNQRINEGQGTFAICGRCWNAAQVRHQEEIARLRAEVGGVWDEAAKVAEAHQDWADLPERQRRKQEPHYTSCKGCGGHIAAAIRARAAQPEEKSK